MKTTVTVLGEIGTEAPANITVVSRDELRQLPGVNADDRLRQIPGFSLFRRTSSVIANPTTQGVSLRGIGSSGASRTLILWDDVPLNDPFGGWVYWTRVDPEELERVEVARGASTSLFGDRALGGSISLYSVAPEKTRVRGGVQFGNANTQSLDGAVARAWKRWAASLAARAYQTDGYYVVLGDRRGSADTRAGVRFVAPTVRLDYTGNAQRVFLRFDLLAEERQNGTQLVTNSTGQGTVAAHYEYDAGANSLGLLAYHTREQYHSGFSSVSADRNTERITFRQTVPAEATGGAALYRGAWQRINFVAGGDFQRADGTSTDRLVPSGVRVGGGTLRQEGVFVQGNLRLGGLQFFAGGRQQWAGRIGQFFAPSGGVAYGRGNWRWRGAVYRGFRAPTLNELYREFRVGNTITQANGGLAPEKLFGAETGITYSGERGTFAVTAFRNDLRGLISNVTLSSVGGQIVRQRRNAADALGRGIEVEARRRWGRWQGELGYLFADSRLVTGERLPQIPKHQGTAQLTYLLDGTLLSAGLRSFSFQFDDDQNRFLLPGYAAVQLAVRQRLHGRLTATLEVENLLGREFLTGLTPTPTIGSPRLVRVGLRWE